MTALVRMRTSFRSLCSEKKLTSSRRTARRSFIRFSFFSTPIRELQRKPHHVTWPVTRTLSNIHSRHPVYDSPCPNAHIISLSVFREETHFKSTHSTQVIYPIQLLFNSNS